MTVASIRSHLRQVERRMRYASPRRAAPMTAEAIGAARTGLIAFTQATKPNYRPAPLHRLIAEHLEAVERGEIDRLLIETPPRHGKSELVSKRFPAWYLGRHPGRHVLGASYADRLARGFGRGARNILSEPVWPLIFPGVFVAPDSAAADLWNIAGHEGGYLAAGVGGPLTGFGADVAIVDDPVKNRQQADSVAYRELVWEWFNDVLVTRLEGEGAIVLTMTRWHRDDLAGRLLEAEPERWTVLRLPAIAERNDPLGRAPGEALWPEKYPIEYLDRLRATDVDFDALYQQNPTSRGGATFLREWFEELRFNAADPRYRNRAIGRWISWDTALKDKTTSDYTSASVLELMPDYRVFVRQVWRGRLQFPDLPSTIEDLARRYNRDGKLRGVLIEDRASGTSAIQTLQQAAPDWLKPLLTAFEPMGSKDYRAAQAAVWARLGCVLLPFPSAEVPWLADFESELFGFPSVAHDDQVDGFVQGLIFLEHFLSDGFRARSESGNAAALAEGAMV